MPNIGLQRTLARRVAPVLAAEAGSFGTPRSLVSDGVASIPRGASCARRPRRSARRLVARNGERTGPAQRQRADVVAQDRGGS